MTTEQSEFSKLFPLEEHLIIDDEQYSTHQIFEAFTEQLQEGRRERIENVMADKTCDITLVLERLYDTGNINAVVRSAENFGILPINIVESKKTKISKRTTQGAHKWVHMTNWTEPEPCIKSLKEKGYRIATTHLSSKSIPISDVDFTVPTAIVLGNELEGVSDYMLEQSDLNIIIPTVGFTESFNISVAAAIICYQIFEDRIKRLGKMGNLNSAEITRLRAEFYSRSVKNAAKILKFQQNA